MKKTRVNKSKETLVAEQQMQKELLRRKTKIKEQLYPLFLDTPFHAASAFIQGSEQVIRSIFWDKARSMKFSDLEMKVTEMSPFPELTGKVLEALNDESVESGLYMLGQVSAAIETFKNNETKDRTVGSYKTDFTI